MQSGREGLISHRHEHQPVETVLPVSTASISLKESTGAKVTRFSHSFRARPGFAEGALITRAALLRALKRRLPMTFRWTITFGESKCIPS